MKKMMILFWGLMLALMIGAGQVAAGEEFPLRAEYPEVKVISTAELARDFANLIVIDVRSTMEYDVGHINEASHVDLSKATFVKDLEVVRGKDDPRTMAFYCNGHTCAKSYKAVKKAAEAGFSNIVAYDAGIFDWIMANPEKATLMGSTPAPQDKIIPKSELQKRMTGFAEFKAKAAEPNAMVIDIRDPFQRKVIPEVPKMRNIPLDRLLGLLKEKQFINNNLLILDAVGKQVSWLQYHLEENGYKNYSFLEKGVAGIK